MNGVGCGAQSTTGLRVGDDALSAAPTTAPNCARHRFCWGITTVTVAMLSDTDVAHFGHLLETELTELLAASERSHDARDAVALDQAQQGRLSRIDAMQQQEMALEQERRRQRELRRVEAAIIPLQAAECH